MRDTKQRSIESFLIRKDQEKDEDRATTGGPRAYGSGGSVSATAIPSNRAHSKSEEGRDSEAEIEGTGNGIKDARSQSQA